ncbi:PucR family transcriptional regulator ligand-binding domain-containing protein [Sporolactobacillus shoreicorticis]|uniref:PucR family transcriptional regulator n=1 Tax=Sporolactobacillus shoreicorticis TaxID=1923877 RepID=A0ABW5S3N0_9BACL|nr:PucR family transcriptional regulator [Sporolactobacillus shoreicorticis]MCO7124252.1 PucR family transcriptional regulator ligand-binding domain-containing protein [Sporolactobacillus shoreicorticis]
MFYSVHQILANPIMQKAEILSGKDLTARPIESVSVIELPVEKFVRKNEFVLTTGIGFGDDPKIFDAFVQEIYASQASALAIATGRHVKTIPKRIVAFAKENNFPLIHMPWEIRFSDVIKTVISGIHHQEDVLLEEYKQLQRTIIALYLDGKSLNDALALMEKHSKSHIYILQRKSEDILSSNPNAHSQHLHLNQLITDKPSVITTQWGTRAQVYPFHILNQKQAALVIDSNPSLAQTIPRSALEQVTIVLQLWFKKNQLLVEERNREKTELIHAIIHQDWNSWDHLLARTRVQDLNVSGNYQCIVGLPEQWTSKKNSTDEKNDLLQLATRCARQIEPSNLCAFYSNYLVIFIQVTDEHLDIYHTLIDLIEEKLNAYYFPAFSWGISDRPSEIRSLSKSYKNARIALETGRSQNGSGSRSTFADTSEFRMLSQLSKDEVTREAVRKIIGPLVSYNKERGLDLFLTLTAYMKHNGNVSQTARALSLQRQSLIYRLQKIETLTGKSLSKSDDLFLLQLCIKLWAINAQ